MLQSAYNSLRRVNTGNVHQEFGKLPSLMLLLTVPSGRFFITFTCSAVDRTRTLRNLSSMTRLNLKFPCMQDMSSRAELANRHAHPLKLNAGVSKMVASDLLQASHLRMFSSLNPEPHSPKSAASISQLTKPLHC